MKVTEGFVESEGHRLAFLAVNEHLDDQAAPPIVFIHGVLASVNFWRDCVPPSFREDRAWYALSLPAHHPSTVPDDFAAEQVNDAWFYRVMHGAIAKLFGDRKAIVVGHSTGGYVALTLAMHGSPGVLGVVSVAGFHSGRWGGIEGLLVRLAGLGTWAKPLFVANLWLAKRSHLVQRLFACLLAHDRRAYLANPLSKRMLGNVSTDVMQQDGAALFCLFHGIGSLEILEHLSTIEVPCALFAGTHDPVVSARQSLALTEKVPHARLVVFQGVGHMPFIEASAAYFQALEQAIAEITRQANAKGVE